MSIIKLCYASFFDFESPFVTNRLGEFFILCNIDIALNGTRDEAENTHLLRKGKYHCTADLLFDWFGFSCFVVETINRFACLAKS